MDWFCLYQYKKRGRIKMKKLALFLALCLLVSSLGLTAFAEEPIAEEPGLIGDAAVFEAPAAVEPGSIGDAAVFEAPTAEEPAAEEPAEEALNQGAPEDYVVVGGRIVEYNGSATSITLPTVDKNGNPITFLSEAAFSKNTSILNVTVPAGIDLDKGCFRGCTNLLSFSNHNNSNTIPAESFEGCVRLQSCSWSQNLTTIEHDAFNGCTSLTGVPYSLNMTDIGDNAFMNCTSLAYVDFPGGLNTIGQGSFYGCTALREIVLPDTVTMIGNRAFEGCSAATKLHIPVNAAFTLVNNYTFSGCSSIVDIAIPANVVEVGREAFYGCSGTSTFRLPAALIVVGNNAFDGRSEKSWMRWDDCQGTANVYIGTDGLGNAGYVLAPINSAAHAYCRSHSGVIFCSTLVRDFVERCYTQILNRRSDEPGLLSWCATICSGNGGASLVKSFIDSAEFRNRRPSNSQIVEVLYRAMLNRQADGSASGWVAAMDIGMSSDRIIWGFTDSDEFKNLCAAYMMKPGAITLTNYRDKNYGVTAYVARCYKACLGRDYDVTGLETWCKLILTGSSTPEATAFSFFFSPEMSGKGLDNTEFVTRLYRTLFGREPDAAGLNAWLAQLAAGKTRQIVFNGFIGSVEYDALLNSFGLARTPKNNKKKK